MFGIATFAEAPFASLGPFYVNLTQTSRFDNTNTFYAATIAPGAVTIAPPRVDNTNTFYSAFIEGGSPVPIPYHPRCQRQDMTVVEMPRAAMTVTELPRGSMTVKQLPRNAMQPGC